MDTCVGYLATLKVALAHTREVFAKMDKCEPDDVLPFHADWHLVYSTKDARQGDLFYNLDNNEEKF